MIFKEGTYEHANGFKVMVTKDGLIFLSPDAPAFINTKDFFDPEKWTKVK